MSIRTETGPELDRPLIRTDAFSLAVTLQSNYELGVHVLPGFFGLVTDLFHPLRLFVS